MTKSHRDRLRGETRQGEPSDQELQFLTTPAARGIFELLGVDSEILDSLKSAGKELSDLYAGLDKAAENLPLLGWVPFKHMPADIYKAAADLAAGGDQAGAAETLVQGWNSGDRMRWQLNRIKALAAGDAEFAKISGRRWELLERAREHHEGGAFEASVLIVLTQMDGLVVDVTGDHRQDFFSGGGHLVDESTVAGHPEGLRAIAKLMNRGVKNTGQTGELARHGIFHGRELGYDTIENSTKAFAALFALFEWAQPIMTAKAQDRRREREESYAGSTAVDPEGRRLDRRGFDATKTALIQLTTFQEGHLKRHGRYTRDSAGLVPDSLSHLIDLSLSEIHIETMDDGSEYWMYSRTPAGYVFGIAGRKGEGNWYYAGPSEPKGGIGSDDWRHFANDPAHVEW